MTEFIHSKVEITYCIQRIYTYSSKYLVRGYNPYYHIDDFYKNYLCHSHMKKLRFKNSFKIF